MSYTEGTWTSTGCTDVTTLTLTGTDECGLKTSTTFTFTISDTQPPTLAGGANGTAECTGSDPSLNAAYIAWRNNFAGVTASDVCGAATMSYTEGTWTSTGCTDVTTLTLTGTDECGLNTSTTSTSTISDTQPPTLRRPPNSTLVSNASVPRLNAAYI